MRAVVVVFVTLWTVIGGLLMPDVSRKIIPREDSNDPACQLDFTQGGTK